MPRQNQDGSWAYSHDEHLYMQQQDRTANFAGSIFNNPKYNKQAKALIKDAYPNLQIPDYDLETTINAKFDERENRIKEAEEKQKYDKQEEERLRLRKEAQDKYNLTDEGMTEVEKLMAEKYIGNYDIAAGHFASSRASSTTPTYDNQFWHYNRQQGFEEISKDPEAWARTELEKAARAEEQRTKNTRW